MNEEHLNALPLGAMLHEYKIVGILGSGGFGITYLASDTKLNMDVAIKEYLPNDLAVRRGDTVLPKSTSDNSDYTWGLDRFLDEAKTLARFNHTNVVQVLRYFEANSTGYMVMRYEDGLPLDEVLKENHLTEEELTNNILLPLLDGLKQVHAAGFLHRDIKPGNIYMRRSDESPVLLDFGAARNALGSKSKSLTSIVTPGYAPFEQYHSDGNQGPWSDIYALGAVAYRIVTGNRPVESPSRLRTDKMVPAVEAAKGKYSEHLLKAIDHALAIDEDDRPQSCDAWRRELTTHQIAEPLKPKKLSATNNSVGGKPNSLSDERMANVKPTKKKNHLAMVVGAVLLLIAGAIMVPQLSNKPPKEIKQVAVDFQLDNKVKRLSYAIGVDIGKGLKGNKIDVNFDAFSKAIAAVLNGSDTTMSKKDAAKVIQAHLNKKSQKISGAGKFQLDYDELKKLSYAMGMDTGSSLKSLSTPLDSEALFKAIGDILSGGDTMMTDAEAGMVKQTFFSKQAEEKAKKTKSLAVTNKARGEKFLLENAKKSGVHVTKSGLQYEVLRKGTGEKPMASSKVRVHYRGTLIDGTEFDSSYKRGQPITFQLDRVIKGWTEGVQLMKVGAKYKFYIPPKLAYGKKGAGNKIGPNSVIVFEVELLGIE